MKFILACALALAPAFAAAGASMAALADAPLSARSAGMAWAVLDGEDALKLNPSGLALLEGLGLRSHAQSHLAGIARQGLSFEQPWSGGGWGLWLENVEYGSVEALDELVRPRGAAYARDTAFLAGVGKKLEWMDVGLSAGTVRQELDGGSEALAWTGLGLGRKLGSSARLGLSWARAVSWRSLDVLRAGLELNSLSGTRLALAGRLQPGLDLQWQIGLEQRLSKALALRLGYALHLPDRGLGAAAGLCLGGGWRGRQWSLDYAFSSYGLLGQLHTFSLGWRLPGPASSPELKPVSVSASSLEAPRALSSSASISLPDLAAPPAPLPDSLPPQSELVVRILSPAHLRGRALEKEGRPAEAVAAFLESLAANPYDLASWRGLARVYQSAGRADYAGHCYGQLMRLDPGDPEARRWFEKEPKPLPEP